MRTLMINDHVCKRMNLEHITCVIFGKLFFFSCKGDNLVLKINFMTLTMDSAHVTVLYEGGELSVALHRLANSTGGVLSET